MVDNAIEIAVLGTLTVMLVSMEAEFLEQVMIDCAQNLIWRTGEVDTLPQFSGPGIIKRLIGGHVHIRVLSLGKQSRRPFEIKFFAIAQAKREESFVGILPRNMIHNLQSAPPHD